jgi:hypothetical protein
LAVIIFCSRELFAWKRREEPLGRPKHRWENNIRMDFGEMGGKVWTGWLRIIWFSV